jgi:23S rRNA pseudouridine1911/1915/1917 synthase
MIEVLYEDNHLLIVNKLAGILTEPSGTEQDSLLDQCKLYIKQKYQKPGNVFLGIVHRLDKPACGIVCFAKTSKSLSRLNQSMRERKYNKTYTAIIENKPTRESDVLEHYLIHDDYKAVVSNKSNPQAKYCKLSYKILKKMENNYLLEIILDTGRYHQIRAQFSAIGCPILGDQKYGSSQVFKNKNSIALQHTHFEMQHPVTNALIVIEIPRVKLIS